MSSPNHPTSDTEDAFSSNFLDYIPASPDYFPTSPGNTSSESSNNSSGLVLIALPTLSLFHNDPYMKVMQACDAINPPQVTIPPPTIVPPFTVLSLSPMFDSRDFLPPKEITPPKDTETPVESPIPISPSSSVGSSSPVRMAPKRTSTSAAPPMTQAAIKKLVADNVAAALEAQAVTMASTSNPNRNTGPTRTPELAVLCPNMVPNTEKLMEAFIGGLPKSIEGNVTTSKPQTLEEAINITQREITVVILLGTEVPHEKLEGDVGSLHDESFPLVPVFLLGLLALAIDAACAFRAEEMPSLISCRMAAKVMAGVSDVDVLLGGILST
ncbi:hypothetical protein Tco_0684435 [Tanacetum coccineum]